MHFRQWKRCEFISLLGGAAAWPLAARAQQPERMRRIGVLMTTAADDPEGQARLAAFVQGLQQLGWIDGSNVRIETRWPAGNADDTRRFAAELLALAPDVILAPGSATVGPLLQATRAVPIVFVHVPDPVGAGAHKLPAVYVQGLYVEAGGLISYGPNFYDQFRRAAGYVDRILKGEKPADLPVQAPTKYELVINLKTAKALGLDMPTKLLALADAVIK
jgi:ABC-type uncharacterized transport system substrate-binding protein